MGYGERLWLREFFRIIFRTLLPVLFVLLTIMSKRRLIWLGLALGITGRPLFRISSIKNHFQTDWKNSFLYAVHATLVIFPQFAGIMRYLWGKVTGRVLQNTGIKKMNDINSNTMKLFLE
jgi:hypothetical protein